MNDTVKYSRTYHLPFSQGLQNDDRRLEDEHCFDGKTVVVSIKMDGENTSCYRHTIHARSLYAMSHPSQHWMKAFWGQFRWSIPYGVRICGENLYARHSIEYKDLESFFQVFNIWYGTKCLPFFETLRVCKATYLTHVPVICIMKYDEKEIERIYKGIVSLGHEGIVIRNIESFFYEDFQQNVAKAVRANHVQTDDKHWTKTWIPNRLKST